MNWTDVKHGRTWQAEAGAVRLTVTRHRDHDPEDWLIEAAPFVWPRPALSRDLEEAKRELIAAVARAARAVLNDCELSAVAMPLRKRPAGTPGQSPSEVGESYGKRGKR